MKTRTLFIIFFILVGIVRHSPAQQKKIDSLQKVLKTLYTSTTGGADTNKIKTLNVLCSELWQIGDYSQAKKMADTALVIADAAKQSPAIIKGKASAFANIGIIYWYQGNYTEALNNLFTALKIYKELGYKKGISSCYGNIGLIYYNQGNEPEALKNQIAALKIDEELADKDGIANDYINIGIIYWNQGKYDDALKNYLACLKIKKELGDKYGMAAAYNNIGGIYHAQGKDQEGLKNMLAALKIREEIGDKRGMADSYTGIALIYDTQKKYTESVKTHLQALKIYETIGEKERIATSYINLGGVYINLKKHVEAKKYLDDALSLSKEIADKTEIEYCYKGLAQVDSMQGNYEQALKDYKMYTVYKDSLLNESNSKQIAQMKTLYETEKKDNEIALLNKDKEVQDQKIKRQAILRNGFIGGFAIVLFFAVIFFTQRNRIKKGKKRSDELLLNILPSEVAEELKQKGSADAKQFDEVTVMFTDFKDFSRISERLSAAELVAEIDVCFKAFDNIIGKHNIEKIKTIGDSYMAVGGLPVANKTNATDVAMAAMEIQQFIQEYSEQKKKAGKEVFEIRIGVHSGPVVAGIVGVKKFAYDIWGDTVNIASRMESSGEAGKVNISGSTYEIVKDKFNCTYRGKIEAKNKGMIDMYFVESAL